MLSVLHQIKSEHNGSKVGRREMKSTSGQILQQKGESEMTEQLSFDNGNTRDTDVCKREMEVEEYENENEYNDCDQWSCRMVGDHQERQLHGNNTISGRQLSDILDPRTAAGAQEEKVGRDEKEKSQWRKLPVLYDRGENYFPSEGICWMQR